MNLTIDIGNTRTKYALFENGTILEKGIIPTNDKQLLSSLINSRQIKKIGFSTVQDSHDIKQLLSAAAAPAVELSHHTALPFANLYATPETLGHDRLAGILGAWSIKPRANSLVIDIGTCITYDILSDNAYQGGNITPGIELRARALSQFTAKLPYVDVSPTAKQTGLTTSEAINCGIYWSCIDEITSAIRRYTEKDRRLQTIITGGGAQTLLPNLGGMDITHQPDLLHYGLNFMLNQA